MIKFAMIKILRGGFSRRLMIEEEKEPQKICASLELIKRLLLEKEMQVACSRRN